MRKKKYSCPNGCTLPPRKKTIIENTNGTFTFGYNDFNFCPKCGSMMPYTKEMLERFFEVYNLHPKLANAENLILKSEFESAAREAFVVVENVLKNKSGLDKHGVDLATKSLSFEVDKKTGMVVKKPLIAVNELITESDRNEQDGVRYMLMGFFMGPRNIYQHNHIGSGVSNTISVVLEASFFLWLLDGHSITKNGRWIHAKTDYQKIYNNMPKIVDRCKLNRMLKNAK